MQGTLSGSLKGTFEFSASAVIASADTPTTGAVLYTGDTQIQTKDGTLLCKESGSFRNTGDGPLVSLCVIVGGTGSYLGASGYITATGHFTSGAGATRYEGMIVLP